MKKLLLNSRGFTLIEMLVVVAITGAIMGAMSLTLNTVFLSFNVGSDYSVATRQVEQAGFYLSRDIQMADSVDTNSYFVSINYYTGAAPDTIQNVYYTISNNELLRNEGMNSVVVARYIDAAGTSIAAGEGNTYILNVTAIYPYSGGFSQNGTFRIQQRAP